MRFNLEDREMSRMNFSSVTWLFVAALGLIVLGAGAEDLLHARVSFDAGGAMIKGSQDADWSYATINTIVLPGDSLWIDNGGSLELEMAGGSFLRMADGSKVEVVSLAPSSHIRGWTGSLYVHRIRRSSGDFVFETPACKVEVDQDSSARFDVVGEGATTVSVRWGRVTVRTLTGPSVMVSEGERAYIDPGCLPSTPVIFDRSYEDSFDAWNRERGRVLAVGPVSLPEPVATKIETTRVIGVTDLDPYGEWVYVDSSYYWRPTVVVDYVPYRYGHWSYVPACGYVWVGNYPFSYVTTHYGRWTYHSGYGWMWTYRDVWCPAAVATVRYGPNFVWCPLDPWDRPVMYGSAYYTVGDVRLGVFGSSYCVATDVLVGPGVIYPCTSAIVAPLPPSQVNIWNIYTNSAPSRPTAWYAPSTHRVVATGPAVTPSTGSPLEVRNYFPQRSIRGPVTYTDSPRAASMRVASLESAVGRKEFGARTAATPRGGATPVVTSGRAAQVRSVQLSPEATSATRAVPGVPSARAAGIRTAAQPTDGKTVSRDVSRTTRVTSVPSSRRTTDITQSPPTDFSPRYSNVRNSTPTRAPYNMSGPPKTTATSRTVVTPRTASPSTVRTPSPAPSISTPSTRVITPSTRSESRISTESTRSTRTMPAPTRTPVTAPPSTRTFESPLSMPSRSLRTMPSPSPSTEMAPKRLAPTPSSQRGLSTRSVEAPSVPKRVQPAPVRSAPSGSRSVSIRGRR